MQLDDMIRCTRMSHMLSLKRWLAYQGIYTTDTNAKYANSIQESIRCIRVKLTKHSVQSLWRAIQKVENHQVLIMQTTKSHQAHVLHPASPYLHMRRQTNPSLGSQRVSKNELENPRLGHTDKRRYSTSPMGWHDAKAGSNVKNLNSLGTLPRKSNSRRRTSAST